MRSIHVGFAAACAMLLAASVLAAPVAMVTDLQGTSTLAKDRAKLGLMAYIEPGSEIQVEANARLTLTYLAKPLEQTFSGPAKIVVQADKTEVLQGGAGRSRRLDPEKASAAKKFEPAARERMTQATFVMRSASPKLELFGPVDTRIASTTPEFSWKAVKDATRYRISLMDESGSLLGEHTVGANTWKPQGKEALSHGKSYRWKVEAALASGQSDAAQAQFSVLDKASAAKLARHKPNAKAPFSERLLYAALLENEGLKYEAAVEWRALAAERPGDLTLQKWAR